MRRIFSFQLVPVLFVLGAALAPPAATAASGPAPALPPAVIDSSAGHDTQSMPAPKRPLASAALGAPVSLESLEGLRGGDSTTTNEVNIRGGVDGNSATNVISGDNIIQNGSFANASGISTVIQNSGNNVLIQNGTVVNVQFVDPGL